MIYTVTLNPAIDYFMDTAVVPAQLNRSTAEKIAFGGKGVNVSAMLEKLGCKSKAAVVTGGFTGDALINGIKAESIDLVPLKAQGLTRINVKLTDSTEINGAGPVADDVTKTALAEFLSDVCAGDFAVLSGSVCRGFDTDIYAQVTAELNKKGALCVIDADGALLAEAVKQKPFLIKPNHIELGRLFSTEINDYKTAAMYAYRLIETGVKNVAVSMGANGLVFVNGDRWIYQAVPRLNAVNTVGAGDCTLAALLYACDYGMDIPASVAYAAACGSARVKLNKFPSQDEIDSLWDSMQGTQIIS